MEMGSCANPLYFFRNSWLTEIILRQHCFNQNPALKSVLQPMKKTLWAVVWLNCFCWLKTWWIIYTRSRENALVEIEIGEVAWNCAVHFRGRNHCRQWCVSFYLDSPSLIPVIFSFVRSKKLMIKNKNEIFD